MPICLDKNFPFHHLCTVKDVTITLPEAVARWLRVRAAEKSRSVSGWLADLLEQMRRWEDEHEVAMERSLARKPES